MARGKLKEVRLTITAALEYAVLELEELAQEVRDVVDAAEGGLAETQRIQTLGETADTLENISAPDVPPVIAERLTSFFEQQPSGRRGLSRASRRDNATSALAAIEGAIEPSDEKDDEGAVQEFIDAVIEIKDTAEGCDFPGMFG